MDRRALTVAVNRLGGELLPDNAQWQHRIQIKSSTSTRFYTVAQHKTNLSWGCSCMGFKRWGSCKHLTNMLPSLQAISAPAKGVR